MLVDSPKMLTNLEDTEARLRDDPDAGLVRPSVTTHLVSNVAAEARFVQYDREFRFHCDEAEARAGAGAAPSPLRYFLSGLGFSQQVWYAKASAVVGVELKSLRIDVSTFMDMRGEHRVESVSSSPQYVVLNVELDTDAAPQKVLTLVDEANARSPLYTLVARAIPVYERISASGVVVRDTVPVEVH